MSATGTVRSFALLGLALVSALAAVDGVYLTLVHLDAKIGTGDLQTLCHTMSETGCSVTAGRFGSLFGIPVALIGFAGAVTTGAISTLAWFRRHHESDPLRTILLILTGVAVATSLLMAGLSLVEGSFCPFCVAWYVLNVVLLVCAVLARNRQATSGSMKMLPRWGFRTVSIYALALLVGLIGYNLRGNAMIQDIADTQMEGLPEFIDQVVKPGSVSLEVGHMPAKQNRSGAPASLQITEFSDFQCPHCKTLFLGLEEFLNTTDRTVQIRFAHYPLNSRCNPVAPDLHPFACGAALAAICAQQQGKFWPYAHKLFEHQEDLSPERRRASAEAAGLSMDAFDSCLTSREAVDQLNRDIAAGTSMDIAATPTFFVNGYRIDGGLPPELLETVIEGILKRAAEETNAP